MAVGPALPQAAQPQGQLDYSPSLFTVMAALSAAGYNPEADAVSNHPLRKTVRDYFATRQTLPSVLALKRFVRDHKPKDPRSEFSQYVSYALLTSGPPYFSLNSDIPLPPDV